MFIKQLSLFVENQPGSLAKIFNILKDHNINVRSLSLADTQQFGILRLLIKEYETAKNVLEAAGFLVKINDVLAVKVNDKVGGLAEILNIFAQRGISIEYMYAFPYGNNDKAIIACRLGDTDKSIEAALAQAPLEVVDVQELFA